MPRWFWREHVPPRPLTLPTPASVLRSCSSSPEATGSAPRSPQPPTGRRPAPTPCCRSPCTSRAAAQTWQRKCVSGGCSWWTWRARSGRPRCRPLTCPPFIHHHHHSPCVICPLVHDQDTWPARVTAPSWSVWSGGEQVGKYQTHKRARWLPRELRGLKEINRTRGKGDRLATADDASLESGAGAPPQKGTLS